MNTQPMRAVDVVMPCCPQCGCQLPKNRLMKIDEAAFLASVAPSHIYNLIAEEGFPAPIKIGVRAARWSEEAVQNWIAARIAAAAERKAS